MELCEGNDPALSGAAAAVQRAAGGAADGGLSGMPRGGGDGRAVEGLAIRELPSTSQREYEAVRRAVETIEHYRNGQERLKVIELVLWKKTHNPPGRRPSDPCHVDTAKVRHGDFYPPGGQLLRPDG